jgi:diphosphomevalonate decarboxylase
MARQISGSACRSSYGGIVLWNRGMKDDSSDSYAEQLFKESYWPELVDVIEIVSASKKKVSSSEGHTRTVQTSKLYRLLPEISESNVVLASEAIRKKDFDALAEIIMKSSDGMHAVMLDSYPPIRYLNDTSNAIIDAIHGMNDAEDQNIAAYTFDAGPNAHIITLEKYAERIKEELSEITGISDTIVSRQGSGPRVLGSEASLITDGFKLA